MEFSQAVILFPHTGFSVKLILQHPDWSMKPSWGHTVYLFPNMDQWSLMFLWRKQVFFFSAVVFLIYYFKTQAHSIKQWGEKKPQTRQHHLRFYTAVWIGLKIREGPSRICCLANRQTWLQQNPIWMQSSPGEPLCLSCRKACICKASHCWITDLQDQRSGHQSTCDQGVNQQISYAKISSGVMHIYSVYSTYSI